MKKYDKLTFISRSDTCRAPMAEALLQAKFLLEDVIVDSRGMIVLFPEPINPKAQEVMEKNQLAMPDHQAEQLTRDDFDERTLMLAMEQAQKEKILEDYADEAKNVYTIAEYCGQGKDVESPLGKDIAAYGECFQILKEMVDRLAEVIKEEDET